MTYRTANPDRLYVCPACASPDRAPLQGGQVACSRCRTVTVLPDRTALPTSEASFQLPPDDPQRLQHLRAQDGRPRQVPPTLQAVLGGMSVQLGREQEALAIWQSLRTRAQQGDVAASEDMATLTLLLVQMPATSPELCDALSESACDAAVLPRHRQEMLGRLSRAAAGQGDRERAQRYLGWMTPWSPELDQDSELRVSAAVLTTLDRDGQRVLALLGAEKDAIPIVGSMAPLASVLRANAHEMLGYPDTAAQILRELPEPRMLTLICRSVPALRLCPQSGQEYAAAATQEGAKRAASNASSGGLFGGIVLVFTGLSFLLSGILTGGRLRTGNLVFVGVGIGQMVLGVLIARSARAKGQRAAWLRANGIPLTARILDVQSTVTAPRYATSICRFALEVAGPQRPYAASFEKEVPVHQIASLIGREVQVRANPDNLTEVVPEDWPAR